MSLQATITNRGAVASTAFNVRFVLSRDDTIDAFDTTLATGRIDSLEAGASRTIQADVLPPRVAPGRYRFGVIADDYNEVAEVSESNNSTASAAVLFDDHPGGASGIVVQGDELIPNGAGSAGVLNARDDVDFFPVRGLRVGHVCAHTAPDRPSVEPPCPARPRRQDRIGTAHSESPGLTSQIRVELTTGTYFASVSPGTPCTGSYALDLRGPSQLLPDLIVQNTGSTDPYPSYAGDALTVFAYVYNFGNANSAASTIDFSMIVDQGRKVKLGSALVDPISTGLSAWVTMEATIPPGLPTKEYVLEATVKPRRYDSRAEHVEQFRVGPH